MATFKPTSKAGKTTGAKKSTFTPTKYAGYNQSTLYGWQRQNQSALDLINQYNTRVNNGEWLSVEDRAKYKSAVDTYTSSGTALRNASKHYGTTYTDEEEKSWLDSLSSLNGGYTGVDKFYNQFKDDREYGLWKADADKRTEFEGLKNNNDYDYYVNIGKNSQANNIWNDIKKVADANHYSIGEFISDIKDGDWEALGGRALEQIISKFFPNSNIVNPVEVGSAFLDIRDFAKKWSTDKATMEEYLTPQEMDNYYYLMGKGDYEKANDYAKYYSNIARKEKGEAQAPNINNNIKELATAFKSGLDSFSTGFDQTLSVLGSVLYDKDVNVYNPTTSQYAYSKAREDNTGLWMMATDAAQSIGNQVPNYALAFATGGASEFIPMAISAGGNSYAEMINEGYGEGSAIAKGVVTGALEALLGKWLGGLPGLGSSGGVFKGLQQKFLPQMSNTVARFLINNGVNMADEALEEGLQELLDPVVKWAVTLGEAELEKVNWEEVGYSALLGGLTAGVLEGVPSAIGTANTSIKTQQAFGNQAPSIVAETLAVDPTNKIALNAQNKLANNKTVSGGNLNEMLTTTDRARVKDAITNQLTEYGETSDISALAEALTKQTMGEELSKKESKLIEASKYGNRIANELNPQNIRSGQYTSKWAESIGTRRLNADVYSRRPSTKVKTKDGTNNTITNVRSVADGVATVELADGKVAKVGLDKGTTSDLVFNDPKTEGLFRIATDRVGKVEGWTTETANAMIKAYEGSTLDASAFARGWSEAYNIGKSNNSQAQLNNSSWAMLLDNKTRADAYNIGKAMSTPRVMTPTTNTYKVSFDSTVDEKSLTKKQKTQVKALDVISKALGVNVVVFDSPMGADGKRMGKNGSYNASTRTVEIDLHAGVDGKGLMMFTAAHELTHHMREVASDKFNAYADAVFEALGENGRELVERRVSSLRKSGRLDGKTDEEIYDLAFEEVVADSAEKMLVDTDALVKLSESLKSKDKTLWEKVKDYIVGLVNKIKKIYASLEPDSQEARMLSEMEDKIENIRKLWVEGIVASAEVSGLEYAAEEVIQNDAKPISNEEIITDGAVVTDGNGNKYSIRSMKHDISEGQMFRDLMDHCGFTKDEVGELRRQLEDLVEYMTPYRDILDMNETYGREGRRYSPYKPNSDPLYTISLDFSTQCSKRLLTQYVIEQLQLRENRPMSAEEQMAIRDMLKEYAKQEKALQVACVMCYVEAARLKAPKQIQKWLDDPATAMRNFFADKNPEFSNYIKEKQADFKESKGYDRNATKKEMSSKDKIALNKIRPKLRAEYQPTAEELAIIETASKLPNSTYLTASNLADLSETHPAIYKAYTAFIRTATRSKALETDEPYYYGDSTRDNGNGIIVSDSFIEAVNRENGTRFSSWSDWRIQHLLDWITAVIDNSVRGAAMHGYTKYGDEVRILGKTGMMFNLSGVADTQTGLNEDGSLSFSDTESIDIDEAIELREEFPETAGLQCIGVSKEHIFALLRSDIIDYVIPYHTSGLNATLRRMGNIHGWQDFTQTQHATEDKSIKKEDAVNPEFWHQEPVFSEFFVGYDTGLGGVEAMQQSAEKYKQMCKERGLTPKFNEFANEPGYWKLLIDRKMVNQKTNTLIKQKAVTPNFDFSVIKEIVDKYVENYDSGLEKRAFDHIVENWDNIPKRIRDLKKQGTIKAKSTKKSIDALANETVAVQPKGVKNSDRASNKEQADDFVQHIKGLYKKNKGWRATDVFEYVEKHPELNFIERIYNKDKTAKADLVEFLSGIDDVKVLDNFSWYMAEAYRDKNRSYFDRNFPYAGATRTFTNAVRRRINEIESARVGGTNLGVVNHNSSLEEIRGLFKQLNTDEDIGKFAERVFATVETLGVNIRFVNQTLAKGDVSGDNVGDMVEYKTNYFNDAAVDNQTKASTLLHELIHVCTTYALHESNQRNITEGGIKNAKRGLEAVYTEIRYDSSFKGEYGITDVYEMVAELSNPQFVEKLKQKTLWERVLDAIAQLFGFKPGNTAYDNAMACIDYLLDNPNKYAYKDYAVEQRQNLKYNGEETFGKTIYQNGRVMYQDRVSPEEAFSNRSLLANALLDTVQSDIEYKKLDDYKVVIGYLEAEEVKLADLKRKIYEATFGDGDKSKLKELREEARKTEARIDLHDKKLLQLESTTALKNVLERAKKQAYSKALEKGREAMHRNVEGRYKTIVRHKTVKIAKELANLLEKGNKKRNIKNGAQDIVRAALDLGNMYFESDDNIIMNGIVAEATDAENLALAKYRSLYEQLHATDDDVTNHKEERKALREQMNEAKKELLSLLERERNRISKSKARDSMLALATAYGELKNSDEDYLRLAYKQEVQERLTSLAGELGDTLIADMSLKQLEALYDAFSMVKHLVTDSNKLFRDGKKEDLAKRVSGVFEDLSTLINRFNGDYPEWFGKVLNRINEFGWNNLRPVDVFELIGSSNLEDLYWDAIKAQDVYARDVEEYKAALIKARRENNYKSWDLSKTQTFKTADGDLKLTLAEMMSIYAYSHRDQADEHLRVGGIQFGKEATYKNDKGAMTMRGKEAHTYRVGDGVRLEIINALTKEQRAYVDTIQALLTAWGEKGNEVSRILYGIDLFKDENYFPLRSSKDFLSSVDTEMGKAITTASLSGSGFTKSVVPHANNPIILEAFDDVVNNHIDKMSKYHAYVIPIENLRKILDAQTKDSSDLTRSVKQIISSKLGDGAKGYLEQYITDLNGGIKTGYNNGLMGLFGKAKGAQVAANLSVWVQQYFSVIRAMAEVNAKYFIPFMGESYRNPDMKLYDEMKKYAPITTIKEMGGFDVGSNRGVAEYVGYEETKVTRGKIDKKMQDTFGVGAALMDKLGWITIWKAVKKEVAATNKYKVGSDEFYKACGERFERVIAKTQVYDSVNARSGNMRNKSDWWKMATSFMGEPTAILGMAEVAIVNYNRAKTSTEKKAAGARLATTISTITISTALTSIAKSLVYAMRDDDEDEDYLEKYASALAGAFKDDLNILNYIPIARDIVSILEGFTVERPDMALIEDLINAFKKVADTDEDETTEQKTEEAINLAGSFSNLVGVPLKNIIRDIAGLYNLVESLSKGYKTDFGGEFKENWFLGEERSKSENIYNAVIRGDTKRSDYYKSTYKDEDAYNSALRKAIRDNDPRLEEAALARLNGDRDTYYRLMMDVIDEGNFDKQIIKDAFDAEYNYQKRKAEENK